MSPPLPSMWTDCWATDRLEILEIDHRNDIHHVDLAFEEFGAGRLNDAGERDEYAGDAAQQIALDAGWIRTSLIDEETVVTCAGPSAETVALAIDYLQHQRETLSCRLNEGESHYLRGRFLAALRSTTRSETA